MQVNNAVVIGPSDAGSGLWVLADGGANSGPGTARGGIVATGDDSNPERIRLGGALYPAPGGLPALDVGARIDGPSVGVLDYRAANYELLITSPLAVNVGGQVTHEAASPAANAEQLTVAAYHVGALGGNANDAAFTQRAAQIVENLAAPDVILLEGMQDDTGSADDGITTAAATFGRLVVAVQAADGPAYQYVQIDPVDNQDGGTGENPRLGFLYNCVCDSRACRRPYRRQC